MFWGFGAALRISATKKLNILVNLQTRFFAAYAATLREAPKNKILNGRRLPS